MELQGLGLIEKIFPIFIGNFNDSKNEYGNYFGGGCHPALPEVSVKVVGSALTPLGSASYMYPSYHPLEHIL